MRLLVGNTYKSNNYGDFKIVDKISYRKYKIRFLETGYETIVDLKEIKTGEIKDRKRATVYGVGIIGDRYPTRVNGVRVPEYEIWKGMLKRCYSPKSLERNPTYKGCTVSENFKSYEYFYEWCQEQKGFGLPDWQLDKDLPVPGNKVYSEDTCCFLPPIINTALITWQNNNKKLPVGVRQRGIDKYYSICRIERGVNVVSKAFDSVEEAFEFYKSIKTQYIRGLAREYKEQISEKAFNALLNFKISDIRGRT